MMIEYQPDVVSGLRNLARLEGGAEDEWRERNGNVQRPLI
jgi:hypothetical protein